MLQTYTVFYYLENLKITEKELDNYDRKMDSLLRELCNYGFIINNFQDHAYNLN